MAKTKPAEAPATDPAAPAKKPTQKEAVIAALAAGKDSPPDGVKFVKDAFDIDLTKGNFSTIKSQVKKAAGISAPARKPGRPSAATAIGNGKAPAGFAPSSGNPADLARGIKQLIATFGAVAVSDMVAVLAD